MTCSSPGVVRRRGLPSTDHSRLVTEIVVAETDVLHSGTYGCQPGDAPPAQVKVHVIDGEYYTRSRCLSTGVESKVCIRMKSSSYAMIYELTYLVGMDALKECNSCLVFDKSEFLVHRGKVNISRDRECLCT